MSKVPVKPNKDPRSLAEQLRDVAIYFAIGTAFLFGALYEADHTLGEPWLGVPWSIFAACTAVMFGFPIGKMRRHWGQPRFWSWAVTLLVIHVIVWIAVLQIWLDYLQTWHFEEWSLTVLGELLLIILVLSRATGRSASEVMEREF